LSCDVALESTVIAHGLPSPYNLQTALSMEDIVRSTGSCPRTVGIVEGEIIVGLTQEQIELFSSCNKVVKAATSEIPLVCALKMTAATTVSATVRLASQAGISVMATGGIGGVHRDIQWDVSQDIIELSRTQMLVVSSGVKSILDMGRTLEFLETFGVTVVGYRTKCFPAFHSRQSPYEIPFSIDTPEEAAMVLAKKRQTRIPGSVLLVNPVPEEDEIPFAEVEEYVIRASDEAIQEGVFGKKLTPYLLKRLNELSDGKTLKANVSLLKNNAELAGRIARVIENGS